MIPYTPPLDRFDPCRCIFSTVMRTIIILCCLGVASTCHAQRILHFTATSGFDHGTRAVSFAMFTAIAGELGIEVVDDATGATFSDPAVLATFDAIIFSNTSGNNILNSLQQGHFEDWVGAGGHVLGIHAATDTYRHSTANGNNTGTWDFYAELIGASVQEGPNHVNGTPPYAMDHVEQHPSTANLPDPWLKNEEYYYWEGGYFCADNMVVLEVEETIGPNGLVNSYDARRPMSWYRTLTNGSKVFYTALGHAGSNYTDDLLFRAHMKDALAWLLEGFAATPSIEGVFGYAYPNPASDVITIVSKDGASGDLLELLDATGRVVLLGALDGERTQLRVAHLSEGHYLLKSGDRVVPVRVAR
jgi:uncharacterized protein